MNQVATAILKTLLYTDLFAWPLTKEELYQKLQSDQKISKISFNKDLKNLIKQDKIGSDQNLYFLKGKNNLVTKKQKAQDIYQAKRQKVDKITQVLVKCPWVTGIFLTGSMAVSNVKNSDDIDLLIITQPQRLWLARFYLVILTQFLGIRRKPTDKKFKDKICLNMFLTTLALTISSSKQNLFTAHEVMQTRPLFNQNQIYERFLQKNNWVLKYLPMAFAQNEFRNNLNPKQFFLLNWLNKLFFQIQYWYMKPRLSNELIKLNQAFFHPQVKDQKIMQRYGTRKKAFGLI